MAGDDFRLRVQELIAMVPSGAVTTYGDLASLAGSPRASRVVGGIAHHGDVRLPWHRLVSHNGRLASGYHGGRDTQARHLAEEGVRCVDGRIVDFEEKRWRPSLHS